MMDYPAWHSRSEGFVFRVYDGSRLSPLAVWIRGKKIVLFRRTRKVQPSRISTDVTCETRASQGDHPLDRPAELFSAPPLTRLSPIFRGLTPPIRRETTPTEATSRQMFFSARTSKHLVSSAGLLRKVPPVHAADPRRRAPALPNRSRMVAARVHLARSRGSRGAGRRVGPRTLSYTTDSTTTATPLRAP